MKQIRERKKNNSFKFFPPWLQKKNREKMEFRRISD